MNDLELWLALQNYHQRSPAMVLCHAPLPIGEEHYPLRLFTPSEVGPVVHQLSILIRRHRLAIINCPVFGRQRDLLHHLHGWKRRSAGIYVLQMEAGRCSSKVLKWKHEGGLARDIIKSPGRADISLIWCWCCSGRKGLEGRKKPCKGMRTPAGIGGGSN